MRWTYAVVAHLIRQHGARGDGAPEAVGGLGHIGESECGRLGGTSGWQEHACLESPHAADALSRPTTAAVGVAREASNPVLHDAVGGVVKPQRRQTITAMAAGGVRVDAADDVERIGYGHLFTRVRVLQRGRLGGVEVAPVERDRNLDDARREGRRAAKHVALALVHGRRHRYHCGYMLIAKPCPGHQRPPLRKAAARVASLAKHVQVRPRHA